jgi:hypothetical protein
VPAVVKTALAFGDILAAAVFIAEDNPDAGRSFID